MKPEERNIRDIEAAHNYRETLIPRADVLNGISPLWHGWAIFDAYLAGLDAGRKEAGKEQSMIASEAQNLAHEIWDDVVLTRWADRTKCRERIAAILLAIYERGRRESLCQVLSVTETIVRTRDDLRNAKQ